MDTLNATTIVTVATDAKGIKAKNLGNVQKEFQLNEQNYMHSGFQQGI